VKIAMTRRVWIFFAAASLCYILPHILYFSYMVASLGNDENFMTWLAVLKHPEYFKGDFVQYYAPLKMASSLMPHLVLFLNRLGLSIGALHLGLMAFQLIAPGFFYVLALRSLDAGESVMVWTLALLSGFHAWNLSHYIAYYPVPYDAYLAVPFCWAGLFALTRRHMPAAGLLLALGSLLHAAFGIYAVGAGAIYALVDREAGRRPAIWLALACASAAAFIFPSLAMASVPQAGKAAVMDALRHNPHMTPWSDPFMGTQLFWVAHLVMLLWISRPAWNAFGPAYERLIRASWIAAVLLMAGQPLGHALEIPALIRLNGLRAPVMAWAVTLPVLAVWLLGQIRSPFGHLRFLAAVVTAQICLGRWDVLPVFLLAAAAGLQKRGLSSPARTAVLKGAAAVWTIFWISGYSPALQQFLVEGAFKGSFSLPFFLEKLHANRTPVALVMQSAVAAAGFLSALRTPWPVVLAGFIGLQAGNNARLFSAPIRRDMYAAQIWAREHTEPGTLFLVDGISWRTYSGRAAQLGTRAGPYYYVYTGDARLRALDEKVTAYLSGISPEQRSDVGVWIRFARYIGADYLVLRSAFFGVPDFGVPPVYRNGTYLIYRIGDLAAK